MVSFGKLKEYHIRDYLNFPNFIEEKDLGITFENNLKFNKHTTKVGGK
jgi:hypothetical protein